MTDTKTRIEQLRCNLTSLPATESGPHHPFPSSPIGWPCPKRECPLLSWRSASRFLQLFAPLQLQEDANAYFRLQPELGGASQILSWFVSRLAQLEPVRSEEKQNNCNISLATKPKCLHWYYSFVISKDVIFERHIKIRQHNLNSIE